MTSASLICLSGIDGAGKTKQCDLLQRRLADSDHRVTYRWCGLQPHAVRPLFRLGERLFYGDSDDVAENYDTKTELLEDWKIRQAYRTLLVPDYLLYTALEMRYCLRRYDVVVSDRYVHDAAIDLSILLGTEESFTDRYDRYRRLVPEPETIVLLDIPPETAMDRKDDIPSLEYLKRRRGMYKQLSDAYGLTEINGEQSIEATHDELVAHLQENGIDV